MQLKMTKDEKKQLMEDLKEMEDGAELTLEMVKKTNGGKTHE